MSRFDQPAVRIVLSLAILVVGLLGLTESVRADSIVIQGDTIPAGTVVDNDAIISGEDVVIDGTVRGDVFAFGNTVVINGTVDGSLISASSKVTINGSVTGTVYVLAGTLELGPTATTDRNVLVASFRLVTERGSVIGRDLHAISVGGQLSGSIGRDLNATIGLLEIIEVIRDSLSKGTSASAGMNGILKIVNPTAASQVAVSPQGEQTRVNLDTAADWILGRVQELLLLLIVAGMFLWLKPSLFHTSVERVRRAPFPAAGLGLIAYVAGFVGAVLLGIVLVFVSIALTVAVSWKLALFIWAVGSSSLFLAFVFFVAFVYYISKVIVGFLVGKLILELLAPRHSGSNLLALLLGLGLYVLLVPIPVLGWLLAFVMSLLGLGSVWLVYLDRRRASKAPSGRDPAGFAVDGAGDRTLADADDERATADAAAAEAVQVGEELAQQDIKARAEAKAKRSGPWIYDEALGSPAPTPIDRAVLAVSDVLAPRKEHTVSYLALSDSDGNPLRGGGEYVISGRDFDARWWSITAYNPDHLIPDEDARHSVSKTTLLTDEDGAWTAHLTSQPRDGENLIHSGAGDSEVALVLRLYNPATQVLEDMGAVDLPEIRRVAEHVDEMEGDDVDE